MLLFLDESGTDHKAAPYEVLGGIAIHERDLWNYVKATHDTQRRCFGGLLRDLAPGWEPKGSSLLGRDKVRLANQEGPLNGNPRFSSSPPSCRGVIHHAHRVGARFIAPEARNRGPLSSGPLTPNDRR